MMSNPQNLGDEAFYKEYGLLKKSLEEILARWEEVHSVYDELEERRKLI